MLKKLCSKCGGIIVQEGGSLCRRCSAIHQRNYDRYKRENKQFYKTKEWRVLTEMCKARHNEMDAFEYFVNQRITKGSVSHHIIPIEDDESLAYDLDNLIYLSDRTHKRIHALYNKNENSKNITIFSF